MPRWPEKKERFMQAPSENMLQESFTETAAFKAAVAESVRAVIAAEMAGLKSPSGSSEMSDLQGLMKGLATNIAAMSTQGTGQMAPVSPDVLAARESARIRMYALLNAAHAKGDMPDYQLTDKIYIGGQIVEPVWLDNVMKVQKPTNIEFYGEPNKCMIPLNECAKEIHKAYLASVDDARPEAPRMTASWAVINGQGVKIHNGSPQQAPMDDGGFGPVMNDTTQFRISSKGNDATTKQRSVLGTIFPAVTETTFGSGA